MSGRGAPLVATGVGVRVRVAVAAGPGVVVRVAVRLGVWSSTRRQREELRPRRQGTIERERDDDRQENDSDFRHDE